MSRRIMLSALAAGCLVSASIAGWTTTIGTDATVEKQGKAAVRQQEKETSELKKIVNQDVRRGLERVSKAVETLDRGESKKALRLLKEAVGDFEVALAADPELNLVPVNSVVAARELYTNPDLLKRELSYAEDLLEDGRVQEARRVLMPLRSDISVKTTYLPMRTYPEAIRSAVGLLVNGKNQQAKEALSLAMGTLFVTEEVAAPVPLVVAKNLVDEASKMDKKKKDEILKKLDTAKQQLEVARLLGYAPEDGDEYGEVQKRIREVMNEVKGDHAAKGMYKELKAALASWLPWGGSDS